MTDNGTKYYKLSYLIRTYGGPKKIFLSKDSWDFYIAVIFTLLIFIFHKSSPLSGNQIIFVIGLNVALIGLILATFAIIFSIQDEAFLSALVASKNYQYLLFQTTWTSCCVFTAIGLYGFLVVLSYTPIILALATFATLYGFLGTVVIVTSGLRKYGIMAARKTQKLRDAWEIPSNKSK